LPPNAELQRHATVAEGRRGGSAASECSARPRWQCLNITILLKAALISHRPCVLCMTTCLLSRPPAFGFASFTPDLLEALLFATLLLCLGPHFGRATPHNQVSIDHVSRCCCYCTSHDQFCVGRTVNQETHGSGYSFILRRLSCFPIMLTGCAFVNFRALYHTTNKETTWRLPYSQKKGMPRSLLS